MKIRKILVASVLALLLSLISVPGYAETEPPPLPHAFYGDLTLYCQPAPAGTVVEAHCAGVIANTDDNPVVTTQAGSYGDGLKLVVQGYIMDGTVITFWVNGIRADETHVFNSGATTRLDLTVSQVTLTAASSVGGSVTVGGEPGGLVSPGEEKVFPRRCGDLVSLSAVPEEGYHFVNWTGGVADSLSPETTIQISGFNSVTANFAINTYPLEVAVDGGGRVSRNPDEAAYEHGTSVELTAGADPGWVFAGWSGDLTGNENPASIVMNGPRSVTAAFIMEEYTLEIIAENGTVIKDPDQSTYHYGDVVTLTAVPAGGYHFMGWNGDASGDAETEITIEGNTSVTADFAINTYSLTVTTTGNGSIAKNPDQANYEHGSMVELTAVPDTGYHFVAWSGDAAGSENPVTVTMDGDKSVEAEFAVNTYTLDLEIKGYGVVAIDPEQEVYDHGTQVTLTATPDLGHHFVNWVIGETVYEELSLTITMEADTSVTANFDDYILISFCPGWNTLSVPVVLDEEYNTWGEFKDKNGLLLDPEAPGYYYDSSAALWRVVGPDYVLRPLEAIFIRVADSCTALIVPTDSPTASSRQLKHGWNLIGLAAYENMDVKEALDSVYYAEGTQNPRGYTHVVSPNLPCQTYWYYIRDSEVDPVPVMEIGKGYWVWMVNPADLAMLP